MKDIYQHGSRLRSHHGAKKIALTPSQSDVCPVVCLALELGVKSLVSHVPTHLRACVRACAHACAYVRACARACVRVCVCVPACTSASVRASVGACTHQPQHHNSRISLRCQCRCCSNARCRHTGVLCPCVKTCVWPLRLAVEMPLGVQHGNKCVSLPHDFSLPGASTRAKHGVGVGVDVGVG